MHQITSAQFKAVIELDPAWASKLTEPVEITDYCNMEGSEITHLSPLLHFAGKNTDPNTNGNCADFSHCKFLKVAEGKFSGAVRFSCAYIERIGDLSCGKDNRGRSATFTGCHSLKIAEGKFEGFVDFNNSSIEKIGELSCGKDKDGYSANFRSCRYLKVAEGKFEGSVDFNSSYIETIGDLSCGKDNEGIRLDVEGCLHLKCVPSNFNPKEIKAYPELMRNLTKTRAYIRKKREENGRIVI